MTMTPAEAARLLQEAGYKIEAPKTQAQLLQEQIAAQAAQIEAQNAQLAELKTLILESRQTPAPTPAPAPAVSTAPAAPAPQRRSLVEGANAEMPAQRGPVAQTYRHGDYLRERAQQIEWSRLTDRSCPLPDGLNTEWLIEELGQVLMAATEEKFSTL